jgi:hypothetical protein
LIKTLTPAFFYLLLLELYLLIIFIQALQENVISEKVIIFDHLMTIAPLFFTTYTLYKWSFNMRGLYVCWSYPTVEFFKGRQGEKAWPPYVQATTSNGVGFWQIIANSFPPLVWCKFNEGSIVQCTSLNVCIYSVPARKYCRQKWTQEFQSVGATHRVPTMDGVVYWSQDRTLFRV